MKKYIFISLTVVILLTGCVKNEIDNKTQVENQISRAAEGVINISAEEAKKIIDTEEHEIVLDVRSVEEYKEGHIEGAVLLPSDEIKEKVENLIQDKNKTILLYCRSGRRSAAAAKDLIDFGYTNVYDFGGIIDWKYEVVKE
ncbi:rhodanese-like domain-containing protein [Clostridium culturomicium]|uniref:rhodanese-like domain-containing protein n=1 Tax=Clostridium culturomicium TaxID=1499683 RepID=UPI00058D9D67|nr:rhodanese-like domain-containing protein [Clostridium culturomicium]